MRLYRPMNKWETVQTNEQLRDCADQQTVEWLYRPTNSWETVQTNEQMRDHLSLTSYIFWTLSDNKHAVSNSTIVTIKHDLYWRTLLWHCGSKMMLWLLGSRIHYLLRTGPAKCQYRSVPCVSVDMYYCMPLHGCVYMLHLMSACITTCACVFCFQISLYMCLCMLCLQTCTTSCACVCIYYYCTCLCVL